MITDLQPGLRANEAERVLERNRRDVAAWCESIASRDARDGFPRSAILRWLLRSFDFRLSGPLVASVSASMARLIVRRFFSRRA